MTHTLRDFVSFKKNKKANLPFVKEKKVQHYGKQNNTTPGPTSPKASNNLNLSPCTNCFLYSFLALYIASQYK